MIGRFQRIASFRSRLTGSCSLLSVPALVAFTLVLLSCFTTSPAPAAARTVRVGVYENAPKVFTDQSGKPAGIFIDIIEEIARTEGWELRYVPGTWTEGLDRLAKGQLDLMPDVAYTTERERLFSFHKVPVLSVWSQVYAPRGSRIQSILDLNGKRVAALEQTIQLETFKRLINSFDLRITLVPVPDYKTEFEMLAAGKADAGITNRLYGLMHARRYGLEDTPIIFDPAPFFFAAPRNASRDLLELIDRDLAGMKKDTQSAYYASLQRWTSEEVHFTLPAWVKLFGLALAGAAVIMLALVVRKRHAAERALRAEKAFAEKIIDSVPGAFYVIDSAGRLVRWNRYLAKLNDLSDNDLQGMDSLRNIREEDRPVIVRSIRDAFEHGTAEAEARIRTAAGERFFLFTGRRIDAGGAPLVVGSGIDITSRKLAELELVRYKDHLEDLVRERTITLQETNTKLQREIEVREQVEKALAASEVNYRNIVEGANSVILRWTPEGRITFFNTFAQDFFGYAEDEILGRNLSGTIVPARDSTGHDLSSLARDIAERPEAYTINENENIRKNGERVWVTWTNRPIRDEQGRVIEILSIGADSTKRVKAERELRHALEALAVAKDRAEAADRLKSAFLATMSHELRTPLNSIIGFTGILGQGLAGPLNDEQKKQLGMVQTSAEHLLALINDVLDISKIEAGQLQVVMAPFDLRAALARAVQGLRPLAEKKGLRLSVEISDAVGPVVSDQRRVEQVMLNLLSNAVKYTERGSVDIDCSLRNGFVRIAVSDTGIGIRREDLAKLFKPFQQLESGLTRRYEGTGLGLSICKRLVELLGGAIDAESEPGRGSTFSFTLPLTGRTP